MFKFVAALLLLSSGAVCAAEKPHECIITPASDQQVSVLGSYQGHRLAFSVTLDGKKLSGFDSSSDPMQADVDTKSCPATS